MKVLNCFGRRAEPAEPAQGANDLEAAAAGGENDPLQNGGAKPAAQVQHEVAGLRSTCRYLESTFAGACVTAPAAAVLGAAGAPGTAGALLALGGVTGALGQLASQQEWDSLLVKVQTVLGSATDIQRIALASCVFSIRYPVNDDLTRLGESLGLDLHTTALVVGVLRMGSVAAWAMDVGAGIGIVNTATKLYKDFVGAIAKHAGMPLLCADYGDMLKYGIAFGFSPHLAAIVQDFAKHLLAGDQDAGHVAFSSLFANATKTLTGSSGLIGFGIAVLCTAYMLRPQAAGKWSELDPVAKAAKDEEAHTAKLRASIAEIENEIRGQHDLAKVGDLNLRLGLLQKDLSASTTWAAYGRSAAAEFVYPASTGVRMMVRPPAESLGIQPGDATGCLKRLGQVLKVATLPVVSAGAFAALEEHLKSDRYENQPDLEAGIAAVAALTFMCHWMGLLINWTEDRGAAADAKHNAEPPSASHGVFQACLVAVGLFCTVMAADQLFDEGAAPGARQQAAEAGTGDLLARYLAPATMALLIGLGSKLGSHLLNGTTSSDAASALTVLAGGVAAGAWDVGPEGAGVAAASLLVLELCAFLKEHCLDRVDQQKLDARNTTLSNRSAGLKAKEAAFCTACRDAQAQYEGLNARSKANVRASVQALLDALDERGLDDAVPGGLNAGDLDHKGGDRAVNLHYQREAQDPEDAALLAQRAGRDVAVVVHHN